MRPLSLGVATGLAALALSGASTAHAEAPAATASSLLGTWYVLAHYRDESTAHPDSLHWLDLVWTFEAKGSRLEWTEYPIVVLEDDTGRFESTPGNPRSRVLAPWQPGADQRRDIDAGPRVNPRGAKTKSLRGSDERGWHSETRPSEGSPLVIGYKETLHVTGLPEKPVFLREDVLGNAAQTSGQGSVRYETERRQGTRLEGRYSRDGIRHGVFQMWRTAPVRGLDVKPGTPNERQAQEFREAIEKDPEAMRALREELERESDERP